MIHRTAMRNFQQFQKSTVVYCRQPATSIMCFTSICWYVNSVFLHLKFHLFNVLSWSESKSTTSFIFATAVWSKRVHLITAIICKILLGVSHSNKIFNYISSMISVRGLKLFWCCNDRHSGWMSLQRLLVFIIFICGSYCIFVCLICILFLCI